MCGVASLARSNIRIADRSFDVVGDESYLAQCGSDFEPQTVALLRALSDPDSHVIDVGANIGLTTIAVSVFCPKGRVIALEPVPRTYRFLEDNIRVAGASNVTLVPYGASGRAGSVRMEMAPNSVAGAFVADSYSFSGHDAVEVDVKRLDDVISECDVDGVDLVKIDVEGSELKVLSGALGMLEKSQPRLLLEMNHWCLNMFQRMTLPEFREQLLDLVPHVFAVDGGSMMDLRSDEPWHIVAHNHLTQFRFSDIIAGFDRDDLLRRFEWMRSTTTLDGFGLCGPIDRAHAINAQVVAERDQAVSERDATRAELEQARAELEGVAQSRSWRWTRPLRRTPPRHHD